VSDDLSHLTPAAAELLQAPHAQRIRAILQERLVIFYRKPRPAVHPLPSPVDGKAGADLRSLFKSHKSMGSSLDFFE